MQDRGYRFPRRPLIGNLVNKGIKRAGTLAPALIVVVEAAELEPASANAPFVRFYAFAL
jgi:hypothetical protein